MKEKSWFLNTALAAAVGSVNLICVILRTFAPQLILPAVDIPNTVLLSLVVLVMDHYIGGGKRCWICIPILSALTFGLIPFAAGFVSPGEALQAAFMGGVVFTVTTWLYTSVQERLSTGTSAKAAPAISALGLYLAAQCFTGLWMI